MRRIRILSLIMSVLMLLVVFALRDAGLRFQVKSALGLEPPQMTPLATDAPVVAQAVVSRPP